MRRGAQRQKGRYGGARRLSLFHACAEASIASSENVLRRCVAVAAAERAMCVSVRARPECGGGALGDVVSHHVLGRVGDEPQHARGPAELGQNRRIARVLLKKTRR
eukprot:722733-Pleurochrysis_carterae.AAC.3